MSGKPGVHTLGQSRALPPGRLECWWFDAARSTRSELGFTRLS